ncbi:MAG: hypothetical protein GW760_04120 [Legionella sp.]|jgi:hypothetical protein|nr:hypothetical protein [Legionella sp.]
MLVEHGAVDTRVHGEYVFEKAIKDGRLDVIKLLSESQPHFWKKNKHLIITWIGLAAGRMRKDGFDGHSLWEPGWPDVVEYLALNAATHGIELNHRWTINLEKSKTWFTRTNRLSSVFELISSGADIDELIHKPGHPSHGKTAVEWVYARERYIEMGLLLDAGARVILAVRKGYKNIVQYLIEKGENVNAVVNPAGQRQHEQKIRLALSLRGESIRDS